MVEFVVTRHQGANSLARRGLRPVVYVFGSREVVANPSKTRDQVVGSVPQVPEAGHIGEQQGLELVFLDIRNDDSMTAGRPARRGDRDPHFEFVHRGVGLSPKSVEVHERTHRIEIPAHLRQVVGQAIYAHIPAPVADRGSDQDRCRLHPVIPQVAHEDRPHEPALGAPLHDDGQPGHGLPPNRFVIHRPPAA